MTWVTARARQLAVASIAVGVIAAAFFALAKPIAPGCVDKRHFDEPSISCDSVFAEEGKDKNTLPAFIAGAAGLVGGFFLWRLPDAPRRRREQEAVSEMRREAAAKRTEEADEKASRGLSVANPRNDSLATWGFLTAIFLPIIGIVIGIVLLSRNDKRGGQVMGLALLVAFIGIVLIAGSSGSSNY